MGVVRGLAAVVASDLDAVFFKLVAQAAPVTGHGAARHEVAVGQGGGAGQGQQKGGGDANSGWHCGVSN
ncbi:hypothetical protein D3C75_1340980 [compost metagenome]